MGFKGDDWEWFKGVRERLGWDAGKGSDVMGSLSYFREHREEGECRKG